jgi:hypothetical protein
MRFSIEAGWTCCYAQLLVDEVEDFMLLQKVFARLKVWHIDQQYKSFQNAYFTVVSEDPPIAQRVLAKCDCESKSASSMR